MAKKKFEKPIIKEINIEFDEYIDDLFSSENIQAFAPDGSRGD